MKPRLYIAEIKENATLTRKEREDMAVKVLVEEAFGCDAIKSNLPTGQPIIEIEGIAVDKAISISHCSSLAVLAVGDGKEAIGVDVEIFREQLRRVVPKFLNTEEKERYTTDEDLLRAWTLKEATYKAARTPGLALTDIHLPEKDCDTISAAGKKFRILQCRYIDNKILLALVAKSN